MAMMYRIVADGNESYINAERVADVYTVEQSGGGRVIRMWYKSMHDGFGYIDVDRIEALTEKEMCERISDRVSHIGMR